MNVRIIVLVLLSTLAACVSAETYTCEYELIGTEAGEDVTETFLVDICSKQDLEVGTVATMNTLMSAVDCSLSPRFEELEDGSCSPLSCAPAEIECDEPGTAALVE